MLAANALTTLERMKLLLTPNTSSGVQTDTEPDSEVGQDDGWSERENMIVELLINRASAMIEAQVGHHLAKNSYHQWYEANGFQELVTLEWPIISVERILEQDQVVDPSLYDYGQTGHLGIIYRDDGWLKAGYRQGLAYDMVALKRAIEIYYTAGYVLPKDATEEELQTLPADLEGLVWDMVAQAWANLNNGSQGLTSFSISDVSWHFDKQTNPDWLRIINLYRRY